MNIEEHGLKLLEMAGNIQKCFEWLEIAVNGRKWFEWQKKAVMAGYKWKRLEMARKASYS